MDNENINALDEISKGTCMGIDAIDVIIDKVEDKNLVKELKKEYKEYIRIKKEIEDIYPIYNSGKPKETNAVNKFMTEMNIDMRTITDTSNSKIAELLLQGMNMGIIEGRKILNNKKIDKKINDIISDFVNMQEASVEALKEYL